MINLRNPGALGWLRSVAVPAIGLGMLMVSHAQPVTLGSLLTEMTDRAAVARLPHPGYEARQASSYNRASTHRSQPDQTVTGWFADGDGLGYLREETVQGRREFVLMEHSGPGCLTKLWTPHFYYDLNERVGPNVRIYLDGAREPVLDESLISLVTAKGSIRSPLATFTARAGNLYLPIPFARSCKITTTAKPFYYIINYRAYAPDTPVECFSRARLEAESAGLERASRALTALPAPVRTLRRITLPPAGQGFFRMPTGPAACRQLTFHLPDAVNRPETLRSTVIVLRFDGEETVWCPLGDFFCSADSLHPLHTWERSVTADGYLTCRWVMPYQRGGELRLLNYGSQPVSIGVNLATGSWTWNDRSLHFHANWRPDDIAPGTPFQDWNFIDIRGTGVYVGDAWTVLNPQAGTWWGEGDEKIYVDDAWERGMPTHFGTGTEDYYGWAGGEVPTRRDEFSVPFLANVRVGGLDGRTLGFNICTRTRSLDAIPFRHRLVFDMESSFGTDIRQPWNLLGYSAVTFWYARPGATHNRPAQPTEAAKPILQLIDLQRRSAAIRSAR